MIEFHRLAVKEVRQSAGWYRTKSLDLTGKFLNQVDRAISRVTNDPESQPKIGRHCRFVKVARFPYILVFQIQPNANILILAVAHTSRRSEYWRRRSSS